MFSRIPKQTEAKRGKVTSTAEIIPESGKASTLQAAMLGSWPISVYRFGESRVSYVEAANGIVSRLRVYVDWQLQLSIIVTSDDYLFPLFTPGLYLYIPCHLITIFQILRGARDPGVICHAAYAGLSNPRVQGLSLQPSQAAPQSSRTPFATATFLFPFSNLSSLRRPFLPSADAFGEIQFTLGSTPCSARRLNAFIPPKSLK